MIAVEIVRKRLSEPDPDMLEAGLAELNLALGPPPDRQHGNRYRRDLVRVIWNAMLDRAR